MIKARETGGSRSDIDDKLSPIHTASILSPVLRAVFVCWARVLGFRFASPQALCCRLLRRLRG